MRLTGHEDLRVRKSITALKKAFEELICEKDYEQIRVSELCERSMVSKKTFYYYYPSLDALLAELQKEYSESYIERLKAYRLPEDVEKITREFFLYSASQGSAYEKITLNASYAPIRQEMIDRVVNATWGESERFQKLNPMRKSLLISFMNTVTLNSYRLWIEDGKRVTIDEMVSITNGLICGGLNRFLNNAEE